MKTGKVWIISGILLAVVLAFVGCLNDLGDPDDSGGTEQPTVVRNAATPQFTAQPASAVYPTGAAAIAPLTVSVSTPTDKGTISFQWYENDEPAAEGGTAIPGETKATYTLPFSTNAPVTKYYYVVVTNYNKNATERQRTSLASSVAIVRVYDAAGAEPPLVSGPVSGSHWVDDTITLTVSASLLGGTGNFTYQWYSNTTASTSGGTLVQGETNESYSFSIATAGTYYYYAVVTNTDGEKTADSASAVAVITATVNPFDTTNANATLTVNTATKYQYVRGFGGMSNVEFRAGIGDASPDMTVDNIDTMFDPVNGLGLNMLRICFYDDLDGIIANTTQDASPPTSISSDPRDNSDYFEIIKAVNAHGGYVLATPWTVPLRMKGTSAGAPNSTGANLTGQAMYLRTNAFADAAAYFREYLERLNDAGAPIFAISAGNETNLADIRYEGMIISSSDMVTLIGTHIGPAIAGIPGYGGGTATEQVWLGPGEPSGGPTSYVNPTMNNATARDYINFVGRHFYSDMSQRYASAINNNKEVWMTEHSDTTNRGFQSADYPQMQGWSWVWHVMNEAWCSLSLNDESAFIWWFTKRFYGFVGDGMFGSSDGVVTNRGYAISHLAKFAKDTTRVQLTATAGSTTGTGAALSASNFNPTSFADGNNNSGGQNGATVKALAFESMDGNSISVVMFTPSQNSGSGAVNMGTVQIDLPAGFTASSAYAMRSNATIKCDIEDVLMNSAKNKAKIELPSSTIVSVKFTR